MLRVRDPWPHTPAIVFISEAGPNYPGVQRRESYRRAAIYTERSSFK